jgi:hypothetical protein
MPIPPFNWTGSLRRSNPMTTYAENRTSEPRASVPHSNVKDQTKDLIQDVSREVKHEVSRIHTHKEPVDPSQSDHVVRRHVPGLSIWFFIAIALFLIVASAAIMIYTHVQH